MVRGDSFGYELIESIRKENEIRQKVYDRVTENCGGKNPVFRVY